MVAGVAVADTVTMMYTMLHNTEVPFAVGTAEFRDDVSDLKLRELLAQHPVVGVGRYKEQPAAVVLAPDRYAELQEASAQWAQVRELMPLFMAAVRAGAAIPSSTLEGLGFEPTDDSWQALNQLQYHMPVRLDSDEEGHPVSRGHISSGTYVEELDEELVTDEA